MSSVDKVGSNIGPHLRDLVDGIVEIRRENIALAEDIKEYKAELKEKDVPVSATLAIAKDLKKNSDDDRQTALDSTNTARELNGLPPLAVTTATDAVDSDHKTFVVGRVKQILAIEADIAANKEEIKERLKKAKKEFSFVPSVVEMLVTFQIDDEAYKKHNDNYALLDSYVDAYDKASKA
jgi:uncharacterized coiled-coil DUF342 family protein